MKKLLFCLSFLLCLKEALPQIQGFFNVYEQSGKSFCASAAIETEDNSLIIAVYDYYGGAGELQKISDGGFMLKRLPIGIDNAFSGVEGLYRDPWHTDSFYAIGHITRWDEQISKPFVMHFSEDLDLLDWMEVDLPGEYCQFNMSRSIFTNEGDFLYVTSLGPQNAYHRLYMRIALDGRLMNFHEETEGCGSSIMTNAIFGFPGGDRFGEYRNSYLEQGYITQQQRLLGFDDNFVFDTIHEYGGIYQVFGDTTYMILNGSVANGTAMSLNDTVLLFSDRAYEKWYDGVSGTTYATDYSTILFSSDLEGDIKKFLVIGSGNDTTDVPFPFNAVDIAKAGTHDETWIYHGCFGCSAIPSSSPYNITLTKTDESLDVVWQKSYTHATRFLQATSLLATNNGGCLVVGGAYNHSNNHYDLFVLKINVNGMVGTDDLLVEDLHLYAYYPNPAQNELHLQYSPDVQPKQIELYDLQGRLVRSQSNGLENLDLQGLSAGQYLMRVGLANGKVFSDKVVKE